MFAESLIWLKVEHQISVFISLVDMEKEVQPDDSSVPHSDQQKDPAWRSRQKRHLRRKKPLQPRGHDCQEGETWL